jgi:hypothetical protein
MNNLTRRWVIDDIIIQLKNKLFFLKYLSNLYKYYIFIINYFIMKKNCILKQKHNFETCYILGTGVSLDNIAIENLNLGKVFACNEIFFHKNFNLLKIDYYATMEPYYGRILGKKYFEDIIGLYKDVDKSFSDKETILFLHPTINKIIKKYNLLNNKRTYFIASLYSKNPTSKLSNDLAGVFNFGQGALSFMIAASIYMGFKKIILLGCGYTFNPRQEYHFYARPTYLKSEYDDSSIFKAAEEYANKNGLFVKEIEETDDKYLPVFVSPFVNDKTANLYRQLKEFAEIKNIEIINIHPIGYTSPIFKGYTWDEYQRNTQ